MLHPVEVVNLGDSWYRRTPSPLMTSVLLAYRRLGAKSESGVERIPVEDLVHLGMSMQPGIMRVTEGKTM